MRMVLINSLLLCQLPWLLGSSQRGLRVLSIDRIKNLESLSPSSEERKKILMVFNGVTNAMQASSWGVRPAMRNTLHHARFHFIQSISTLRECDYRKIFFSKGIFVSASQSLAWSTGSGPSARGEPTMGPTTQRRSAL